MGTEGGPSDSARASKPVSRRADRLAAEEENLVAQLAAGERGEPLVALYDRYATRLYGLGMRLLGDPGMAEEMVQDTFVRLWRSAPRFDAAQGTVRTFVFMIARRVAVDLRRRPSSRPLSTDTDATGSIDRSGLAADDELERLVVGLEIRDALDSLSDKHRETLELHYDTDLTQPQISERLGIPLGTVKTRTHHGLRALRAELEEREIVD